MSRSVFSVWLGTFAVLCLVTIEPAFGQMAMQKSFGMKGGKGGFAQGGSVGQAGGMAGMCPKGKGQTPFGGGGMQVPYGQIGRASCRERV